MKERYIKLEDVSVSYNTNISTLEKIVAFLKKESMKKEIDSLKNINLDLRSGDRLALIGQNGAGKSTMLKTLAGIYQPKSGRVVSHGRMASLLDLSMGFNPHDTGLGNVSRKLLFMGLNKQEIKDAIPDIATFSELGDYINLPVNTYSSGMRMRLAFATATCVEPEILLMDEWISTGDRTFLEKVKNRLESYVEKSEIVVFASHSFNLLRNVCNKGAVLQKGEIAFLGTIEDSLEYYDREIVVQKQQSNKTQGIEKIDFRLEKAIFLLEQARKNKNREDQSAEIAITKANEIMTEYLNKET
jgi:homopolymeric O-antigen transport system ATP-binding protein